MKKQLAVIIGAILAISAVAVMPAMAMASDWQQFQKDETNIGITDDFGPVNPDLNFSVSSWKRSTETGGWYGIDTVPIVVGDYVYVVATSKLFKFNKNTGEEVWNATIDSTPNFQLSTPAYGNGKIFVANTHGELYAINATTGDECWHVSVCDGQLNTPIVYYKAPDESQGRIFFGDWNGPKKYYCYWENGTQCWSRSSTSGGGYYWAGAAVIGDYLVYGDDAGYLTSVFFFKQKTAYEIMPSLVGSEMCIRDRFQSPKNILPWLSSGAL